MINAVIYARFSSSSQREESIDTQIRECMSYAHRHDMIVIKTYSDKAKSGRTANRPQFQRMVKDAETGKFQAVILYTIDRFARNRFDAAYYKAKLKDCGVKVYYAKQDMGDGPEAILIEAMMEGYAEYYSASLSRAVKAGQEENALHCKCNGALPYGLMPTENRDIVPNPDEAPLVRRAFEMYALGNSARAIANLFNAEGYRLRNGTKFKGQTLTIWFRNQKYRGVYTYGNYKATEGAIPAIVDDKLWERVQLRLSESSHCRPKYKAKEVYLLSPKLICGCCGEPMYGESGTSRNGELHTYYKCITRKKNRGICTKRTERKGEIEYAVLKLVKDHFLTPEAIEHIAQVCIQTIEKDMKDNPERKMLSDRLAEVEKALSTGWRAVEQGYSSQEFFNRLNHYEQEKTELVEKISQIDAETMPLDVGAVSLFLEHYKANRLSRIDYDRFLCNDLIDRVVLTDQSDGTFITAFCSVSEKIKNPNLTGSDITTVVEWCIQHPNTPILVSHALVACGAYYIAPV